MWSVTVGVAVETSVTVIGISGDLVMIVVHRVLVVVFVAIDAGEHAVVRSVVVAIGTRVPFPVVVAAVDGEELAIMIERCVAPCRLIMALGAIRAETGRCMVRVAGAIIIVHMAGTACRRGSCVSVRMAIDACRGDMATVEREVRVVVIERRVAPCRLIMAHSAIRAESRGRMVGIGRAVVLRHVACAACRRGSRVSVRMTLDACRGDVATMQREIRDVMVE